MKKKNYIIDVKLNFFLSLFLSFSFFLLLLKAQLVMVEEGGVFCECAFVMSMLFLVLVFHVTGLAIQCSLNE